MPLPPHIARAGRHILFWLAVVLFYTLYFGSREDEYGQALLFVGIMLPITIATAYFIMYWLIPRYAMRRRYGLFGLYLLYTLMLSVYAELMLLVGLYIQVSGYQALFVNPSVTDQMEVMAGMYMVVLVAVSVKMWLDLGRARQDRDQIEEEKKSTEERLRIAEMRLAGDTWEVRADRKTHRVNSRDVRYVESIRDYVKIHRQDGILVSKMKLSDAEQALTHAGFVRVHRSYLVNLDLVSSWSSDSVVVGEDVIPIGRSYRSRVMPMLDRGTGPRQ